MYMTVHLQDSCQRYIVFTMTARVRWDLSAHRGEWGSFGEETEVATDINHAETVADAFLKSCGTAAFRWLYCAFM